MKILLILITTCYLTFAELNETTLISVETSTAMNPNLSTETTGNVNDSTVQVSTEISTSTKGSVSLELQRQAGYCFCDLKLDYCDINCCCDKDCSESHLKLFDKCAELKKKEGANLCVYNDIIFANNTRYTQRKSLTSLFCVLSNNVKEKTLYTEVKPASSLEEARKLSSLSSFGWKFATPTQFPSSDRKTLRFGDQILVRNCQTLSQKRWSMSTSFVSLNGLCDAFTPVKFLQDSSSKCRYYFSDINVDCVSDATLNVFSYLNISVLNRNSQNFDINRANIGELAALSDCSCNECVNIELDELHASVVGPTLMQTTTGPICLNVVQSVHYTVSYNPLVGISQVTAKFGFANLTTGKQLRRSFVVQFLENNTKPDQKSGNLGYEFGKPVIAIDKRGKAPYSRSMFLVGPSGNCAENSKQEPLRFGISVQSNCLLSWTTVKVDSNLCEDLQQTILNVSRGNTKDTQIGIFGSSNESISSDWIPILENNEIIHSRKTGTPKSMKCPDIVTGYTLKFIYTKSGTAEDPQNKLIAAVKTYTKPMDIELVCTKNKCETLPAKLALFIGVNFKDSSNTLRVISPPTPLLRIKLPTDFFYPFLTNGLPSSNLISNFTFALILLSTMFNSYFVQSNFGNGPNLKY